MFTLLVSGKEFDTEKKKHISRFLRLTAHINGAALIFVTTRSETLINKLRGYLGHLAFGTSPPTVNAALDHNKPIVVPFGGDSFELIGYNSLDTMRRAFVQTFPQVATKVVIPDNPAKDPNFRERDIDLVRAHKDKASCAKKLDQLLIRFSRFTQALEEHRRQLELRHNIMMP